MIERERALRLIRRTVERGHHCPPDALLSQMEGDSPLAPTHVQRHQNRGVSALPEERENIWIVVVNALLRSIPKRLLGLAQREQSLVGIEDRIRILAFGLDVILCSARWNRQPGLPAGGEPRLR